MWKWASLIGLILILQGCQKGDSTTYESGTNTDSSQEYSLDQPEEKLDSHELADGSYSCEASNSERGYGPYDLECEKNGDEVTIYFPNGGHIVNDIDDIESDGSGSWSIDSTHPEEAESWQIDIQE